MRQFKKKTIAERGSMMVEALAMLGLITMVTPILYKKAAERTTELQDINTATQMRMVSAAFDQYIKDNYSEIAGAISDPETPSEEGFTEGSEQISEDKIQDIEKYLPAGYSKGKMFEDFQYAFKWKKPTGKDPIITTAVKAPYREDIARARSSKIASMVGANGGNYLDKALPGDDNKIVAHGVQGLWELPLGEGELFSVGDDSKGGLVVISSDTINSAGQGDVQSDKVLYRVSDNPYSDDGNTMETNLHMDGHPIDQVTKLIAASNKDIELKASDGKNIVLNGITNITNTLSVMTNKLKVDSEGVSVGTNLTVGNQATIDGTLTANGLLTANNGATINGPLTANNGATINSGQLIANSGAVLHGGGVTLSVGSEGTSVSGGEFVAHNGATINSSLKANGVGNLALTVGSSIELKGDCAFVTVENGTVGIRATTVDLASTNGNGLIIDNSGTTIKNNDQDDIFQIYGIAQNKPASTHFSGKDTNIWADNNTLTNVYDLSVRHDLGVGGDAYFDQSIYLNGLKLENKDGSLNITNINNTTMPSELYADWIIARQGFALVEKNSDYFKVTPSEFYYRTANDNLIKLNGRDKSAEIVTQDFTLNSPQMKVMDGYTFFGSGMPTGMRTDSTDPNTIIPNDNVKVAISNQKGIIDVASPESNAGNEGGYIRTRRVVADTAYPHDKSITPPGSTVPIYPFKGRLSNGSDLNTEDDRYDYYQVNPAYTSVMNDIKLSSRGGARLSDILPDYINKGIYVVDNTYSDEAVTKFVKGISSLPVSPTDKKTNFPIIVSTGNGFEYKNVNGTTKDIATFDNDNSCASRGPGCQASPWLGFVPTPLCPPHYDMAITLNPFRWKMAEVYAVTKDFKTDTNWKDATNVGDAYNNLKNNIQGENFMQNFNNYTNPADAQIGTLHVKTPGEGETDETKEIYANEAGEGGRVTNYQINTWLNTALTTAYEGCNMDSEDSNDIASCNNNPTNFMGWHTIMGFMYHGTDYSDFLGKVIYGRYKDDYNEDGAYGVNPNGIYWNVFPVYAGELAGFATTYCVFNRHPLDDNTGQRYWMWGNDGPVVPIDQLNNFRKPYNKPSTPFLDPDLPYKDAW